MRVSSRYVCASRWLSRRIWRRTSGSGTTSCSGAVAGRAAASTGVGCSTSGVGCCMVAFSLHRIITRGSVALLSELALRLADGALDFALDLLANVALGGAGDVVRLALGLL